MTRVPRPVPAWNAVEQAWLAGLLEGEGSFTASHFNGPRSPRSPRVTLAMCDQDIVERAAALMGAPSVHSKPVQPTDLGNLRRPQWQAAVMGFQAVEVMARVRPTMGARRRARIDELITEWYAARPHLTREEAAA
ncbi:hypothetical protein ACPXB5_11385 [Micromonospora arida]|uniref:hypothetical protein n=1 Tax=Micromonospora arida TaxID=2203715 RepID=UPI003CEF68A5